MLLCFKVTYADLAIFNLFDYLAASFHKDINLLLPKDKVPKLAALWQKVKELPTVAAYLEKRPLTS